MGTGAKLILAVTVLACSGPFFLACGLFRPHLPWYVPQKYFDLYPLEDIVLPHVLDDDLDDVPAGDPFSAAGRSDWKAIQTAEKWQAAVRAYLASITYADDQLGRVLAALDQSPQAANTVIVLWSDHGWHLGEKQHWHKSTLWEEASRVPLVIRFPDHRPGVCHRPVSLLDLYPTLIALAGLGPIESHDGVSLVPLLRDPLTDWDRPAVIEFQRGNAAVRSDRYRYIRYRNGGEELYDHQTDPSEWHNLADRPEQAHVKQELAGWIASEWAESAPTKNAFDFDPTNFTWTDKRTGRTISGNRP